MVTDYSTTGLAAVVSTLSPLALVNAVKDPEIPVLSIGDLGIVRSVEADGRCIVVTITPTYSGCPAMDAIRSDITAALVNHGFEAVIRTVYSPAWTTDMISEKGRRLLSKIGIAPPSAAAAAICPRCLAPDPAIVSEFGSTACKALLVCSACREPFDLIKVLK